MGEVFENVPVDLSSATITSEGSSDITGFSDPRSIVNNNNGQDGAGKTWLLANNTAGYWQANNLSSSLGNEEPTTGVKPTILQMTNTNQDGRGTKNFAFTFSPNDGIANFSYQDPDTGQEAWCDAQCPLASMQNNSHQDYHFVNVINMDGFKIDISEWYGDGGGLDGILLVHEEPIGNVTSTTSTLSATAAPTSTPGTGVVTVTANPTPTSTSTPRLGATHKLSAASDAGIAIGVAAFVVLLVAALLVWRRIFRNRPTNPQPPSSPRHRHLSEIPPQELDGRSQIHEKDGGAGSHEIEGGHWKREMEGKGHIHELRSGSVKKATKMASPRTELYNPSL